MFLRGSVELIVDAISARARALRAAEASILEITRVCARRAALTSMALPALLGSLDLNLSF